MDIGYMRESNWLDGYLITDCLVQIAANAVGRPNRINERNGFGFKGGNGGLHGRLVICFELGSAQRRMFP
jgi:hypothetical protein